MDLPTHNEICEKIEAGLPLTALEHFIYENDPANPEQSEEFYLGLELVLQEAGGLDGMAVANAARAMLDFMRQNVGDTADWPMEIIFDDDDLANEFCEKVQALDELVKVATPEKQPE